MNRNSNSNSKNKTKKNSHSPRSQSRSQSRNQLTYEFKPSLMNVLLDGHVVGSVTFNINNDIFIIDTIYVESHCRGCGIGKFILKNILMYAFSNPVIQVVKLTDETQSNQFNPNRGSGKIPNKMYLKSGFEYINITHSYFKNDMILTKERYTTFTLPGNYLGSISNSSSSNRKRTKI